MNNDEVITRFYTAFQKKDFRAMQQLYADTAVFSDPVFTNLDAKQVRAMWEMLILRGKDMTLEFKNVQSSSTGGSAEWVANYTFSATGRHVENRIKATFEIDNGKIIKHTDVFDFKRWSKQAFGFRGWLLGGTSFLKNKVQENAMGNLKKYMERK
ncbi:MAG: nuclear transport factor 2 family protein [Bacteroidetes bacterium]|jgi:ketosteroid isomerase-like protein|nr:nuclear transport factor 2 family protein [Bacteroidota bacterium]